MLDPTHILLSASYLGLLLIVFAESGLLLGFFLPGDSLLLTAGILAQQGKLSLAGVILAVAVGAVLGDSTGYFIGRRFGPGLFRRQNSRLFRPEYVDRTQAFFNRHGGLALILARFVPVVRTGGRRADALPDVSDLQRGGRRALGNGGAASRVLAWRTGSEP